VSSSNWIATENRVVEPFARVEKGLSGLQFRTRMTEDPAGTEVWWFDDATFPEDFIPELTLAIDVERCAAECLIPATDLVVSVIVRDRAIHRWEIVATWPLGSHPATFQPPIHDTRVFANGRWMDFVVAITPAKELARIEGRAWEPTSIVGERTFTVKFQRSGSRFSVGIMPEKWFVDHGMDKTSVWAIDWMDTDVTKEPAACFLVCINESHEQRVRAAFGGDLGTAMATQIATEVFVEIASVTLTLADEFDDDPTSLIGTVVRQLGIRSDEEFQSFRERLRGDSSRVVGHSIIRGRIQAALGLHKALLTAGKD
jgi:hypothetical protein